VSERGQISIVACGLLVLLVLGGVLLGRLAGIGQAGAVGQRSADMAALAAAKELAAHPDAAAAMLEVPARRAAAANGGKLVSLRLVANRGVPEAVDVVVHMDVPDGPVIARARAAVTFSARLDSARFRPVDLRGLAGRAAVVAAAAAQIGWPYVWGGESRAEGGFDCSGLIGYAFSAAGSPLPGRPTADSLWRMSQPISSAELQPGDLVFAGTSGTAYHVGLYAGEGQVLSAPHTGAVVGYSPLAAGSWDGFGRLLAPAVAAPARNSHVEQLARRHGVPWHVLEAERRLGLIEDTEAAAADLAAAQRRHPGSLEDAVADQLGSASAAALVLRAGSGAALGDRFTGEVRLVPVPGEAGGTAAGAGARGSSARKEPSAGRARPRLQPGVPSPSLGDRIGAVLEGGASVAETLAERGRSVPLQASAAMRTSFRLGLTGLSGILPDPGWREAAGFAGAVWDAGGSIVELGMTYAAGGAQLGRGGLWAARFSLLGGALSTAMFAAQAFTARTRRDRIGYGMMAVGSAATTVGLASGGAALMTLGAGTAVIPPVGLALIATGATLCVAGYLVRHPEWCRSAIDVGGRVLDTAWKVQTAPARAVASAGGAVVKGAKAVLDAVPTPW
jgi:cell wall-associated NlpC family hydrolase